MTKLFVLVVISLYFVVINSQKGIYPESGVFVSLNENFLATFGNEFTTTFENQINAYSITNVNGKNGDISYSVSNIHQSITLDSFTYEQTSENNYNIGWNSVTFTINTDYQGCYKIRGDKDLSVCEKGKISISSTSTLSLIVSITLNFNQSTPSILCTGVTLSPDTSINYNVQCTSKVCDKTHDIRNDIAQQFVPQVESTITKEINENSGKYLPLFPTLRNLNVKYNDNEFYLNSQGSLIESGSNSVMTIALQGGIVVQESNGNFIYPTQSPSGLPSYSELESFSTDIAVTLTPFVFESLFDSVSTSILPITITPNQVPSASPVKLNTSDPFFNQSCPGLTAKYPNSPIDLIFELPSSPISVSLNSTGILLLIEIPVDFQVESSIDVFQIVFQFQVELTPALSQNSNGISITGTIDKFVSFAKVTSSIVGDVDTTGFLQLIQLAEGLIKVPTITIQNPLTKFTLSNLSLVNSNQFIQIFGDLNSVSNKFNLN